MPRQPRNGFSSCWPSDVGGNLVAPDIERAEEDGMRKGRLGHSRIEGCLFVFARVLRPADELHLRAKQSDSFRSLQLRKHDFFGKLNVR